ncbi:hypothetical protein IHQ71_02360 [Rhizobium sp. TH2]|uniref:hypothetical protein n=1 Tax=Rhizobium sp. TH2 TaxID=2775403 RepID=UPI002157132B|nr:hypothetical protein [Rhizobium sp. TH2]UVC09488.1 hypothetical protein IHQ71_02360 [Rhizobium sp. TH2]
MTPVLKDDFAGLSSGKRCALESKRLSLIGPGGWDVDQTRKGSCREISRLATGQDRFGDGRRQESQRQDATDVSAMNTQLGC